MLENWKLNSDRKPAYELRNAANYFEPPAKHSFFERCPLHLLPKVWNNAGTIKCYDNPTTFKIALNEDLFNKNEEIRTIIPLPPLPTTPTQPPLPPPTTT